ncbi:MAG: class I SAM-dependent methyltransferase, partial [Methylocella sp.]
MPKLGGSPLVWSFALVFFQLVLLLGYLYAHVLVTRLPRRAALCVHVAVLALAFALLPIGFPTGWEHVSSGDVVVGLASVFALGTGLQFFAVSATAPLLQGWFSRTGHPQAADPYFLYGASNLGSFAALALYPFLIEPILPLGAQTSLWTGGFFLLIGLIIACGLTVRPDAAPASKPASATTDISRAMRLRWVLLSAVPSGLLVAVTAYITTDVVAAPFLWALPLALYLLTFVIVFAKRPPLSHSTMLWLHATAAAPFAIGLFVSGNALLMVPLHLAVFFICAMVCHGELARIRPEAARLTEFYVFMSLGGVLGGLFSSLLAPAIFDRVLEYPILLCAVFLCRGDLRAAIAKAGLKELASAALAAGLIAAIALDYILPLPADSLLLRLIRAAAVIGIFSVRAKPIPQAILVALGLTAVLGLGIGQVAIDRSRSLFGVHMVTAEDGGRFHVLTHGTTIHGAQE